MNQLVVNAGSSSLKLCVLDGEDNPLRMESLPAVGGSFDPTALQQFVAQNSDSIDAVGHRIVHGGTLFVGPTRLDHSIMEMLKKLIPLAPLHQAACLRATEIVSQVLGEVPSVGCFDTAFHAGLPEPAATYAVPLEWRTRLGVRRFGFHGLSHGYAWRRTIELMGHSGAGIRLVSCHLGAGASLAAIAEGRSIDTTMGFTPLEGLVMATRQVRSTPASSSGLPRSKESRSAISPTPSSTNRVCSPSPALRTCPRSKRWRRRTTTLPGSRSMSTCTGCGPGSPRWRVPSVDSMPSLLPEESERMRPSYGPARSRLWDSLAFRSTTRRTVQHRLTPRSQARVLTSGSSSCERERTCRSHRKCARSSCEPAACGRRHEMLDMVYLLITTFSAPVSDARANASYAASIWPISKWCVTN